MECSGNISIRDVGSKEEEIDLTYKIKDVGSEDKAKELKEELDEILREKYKAITTLDEFVANG